MGRKNVFTQKTRRELQVYVAIIRAVIYNRKYKSNQVLREKTKKYLKIIIHHIQIEFTPKAG